MILMCKQFPSSSTFHGNASYLFAQIQLRWAPVHTALELPESLVLERSYAEMELFTENTSCGAEIFEELQPLPM